MAEWLSRADDIAALEILHARENLGLTMKADAAHASAATGRNISRNQAIGIVGRVNEAVTRQADRCRRKANRDGGMPERWWA